MAVTMVTSFAENGKNSGSNVIIISTIHIGRVHRIMENYRCRMSEFGEVENFQLSTQSIIHTYQRKNDSSSCFVCQWHMLRKIEKINFPSVQNETQISLGKENETDLYRFSLNHNSEIRIFFAYAKEIRL